VTVREILQHTTGSGATCEGFDADFSRVVKTGGTLSLTDWQQPVKSRKSKP
jgi:hypothetical protein